MISKMNERQMQIHAEKRVCDLELDIRKMEEENNQFELDLKDKKKYRHLSNEDLRQANEWTFDEANLVSKINDFARDIMFLRYKFLKERWQDRKPSNKKSVSYFVAPKMSYTY